MQFHLNPSQLFYALNDTFIGNFTSLGSFFFIVTEKGMKSYDSKKYFSDRREMCSGPGTPYTGAYTNRHLLVLHY
jgi:hypothetical protein